MRFRIFVLFALVACLASVAPGFAQQEKAGDLISGRWTGTRSEGLRLTLVLTAVISGSPLGRSVLVVFVNRRRGFMPSA